jgi:hypothetical protein
MPAEKTIRAIRHELQVIQSAEGTTGSPASKVFNAVQKIDALLTRLEAQIDSVLDERTSD